MHLIRRVLLAALLLFAPGMAHAACVVSNGTLTFTQSSSYTVQSNTVPQVSAPAGFACNGSLIALLSSNSARATITSAGGFKLTGPSGDKIPYAVAADSNGAYSFTQGSSVDFFNPTLLSLLSILDGGNLSPKLYATVNGSANVAAGTYTDTLTVQWAWNVCHGIGIGNVCVLGESGTGTSTIQVSITVEKDCRITAPPVVFGSAPLASQFNEISQSVLVDCTKGAGYNVGLTAGSSGNARPWRTMKTAGGAVLQYNLYKADGTTIWDESNPQSSAGGTGGVTPTQPFAYRARVNPNQTAPAAGAYSDTVSVVVTF